MDLVLAAELPQVFHGDLQVFAELLIGKDIGFLEVEDGGGTRQGFAHSLAADRCSAGEGTDFSSSVKFLLCFVILRDTKLVNAGYWGMGDFAVFAGCFNFF